MENLYFSSAQGGSLRSPGDSSRLERRVEPQFYFLLFILIWAPLPLGSDRPWSVGVLGLLVCLLALWTVISPPLPRQSQGRRPIERAGAALLLMGVWLAILAFQLVPLPGPVHRLFDFAPPGYPVLNPGWNPLSVDPYSTKVYLLKGIVFGLFFWLLLTWSDTRHKTTLLVQVLVACGLFQAVLGVVLFAADANYRLFFVHVVHTNALGTFNNRDHLAGYMEMTLALGIGLMISRLNGGRPVRNWRQRLRGWLELVLSTKALLRVALIVMVIGLIATRSRMGNSAFFVSLLVTGTTAIVLSKYATRSTVIFISSLIILDIVIIGSVVGIEKVMQRIESTNLTEQARVAALDAARAKVAEGDAGALKIIQNQQGSVQGRVQPALFALQIVKDFPFLGTGGGTFHSSFMPYRPRTIDAWFDHAHNDYVEFAVDGGLIGVTALGVIVLSSVAYSILILKRRRDPLARGMAFSCLMGIIALMQHSLVDFNLQITANAMLFIVIIALPYLVGWKSHER